jgi:hypothetical protein
MLTSRLTEAFPHLPIEIHLLQVEGTVPIMEAKGAHIIVLILVTESEKLPLALPY